MNTEQNQPDLTPYMEVIQSRFYPAKNSEEATHRLSTAEIKNAIISLNPGINCSEENVFDAMIESGFKFDALIGTQSLIYQWLLIEK